METELRPLEGKKRKKRNKEENLSSDVLGPGLGTFSLHAKVECGQAPNPGLLFLCDILQSSQKGGS